jgi:hypothetical protein
MNTASADAAFLAVLPTVQRNAQMKFRYVRCVHQRADLIQEVLAYGLKWTRLLWARGKDVRNFPARLAHYAVLAVRNGRRLCGSTRAKDVTNTATQARVGFACGLADHQSGTSNPVAEALHDNTRSDVADQAAFRIDFPVWLLTCTGRDRRIIGDMLRETRTLDLARKYRLSEGRISQLRRKYCEEWRQFHGEAA